MSSNGVDIDLTIGLSNSSSLYGITLLIGVFFLFDVGVGISVLPKPFVPRIVSSNVVVSQIETSATFSKMSCAILEPLGKKIFRPLCCEL